MKNFFAQTGKALAYFATYMGAQLAASVGASFIFSMVVGYRAAANGQKLTYDESVANTAQLVSGNIGYILIANAIIALAAYLIVTKIRKHKFTEEISLKKISPKTLLLTLMATVGSIFFLNYGMDVLPLPEDLVEATVNGNQQLLNLPIWQGILATSIMVPIMEEIVFRGFVFSRLDRVMNSWVAAIITSILFGLIHGQIIWIFWAAAMGFVMNALRIKTGSLLPGIILHVTNNSFSTFKSATGFQIPAPSIVLVIIGAILLVISFILLKKEDNDRNTEIEVITVNA